MIKLIDMLDKKIKYIVFDLEGTLIHKRPHIAYFLQVKLKKEGFHMTEDQLAESGRWSHRFWNDPPIFERVIDDDDEVARKKFWLKYLDYYYTILEIPYGSEPTLFSELAAMIVATEGESFVTDETYDVLSELKENGYHLSVLSNRNLPLGSSIEAMGLDPYFEVALSAGELGEEKPQKEIFEKHLEIIKGTAKECVYIGDNYWLDILGAKSAGMTPILLDRYDWFQDVDCLKINSITELTETD